MLSFFKSIITALQAIVLSVQGIFGFTPPPSPSPSPSPEPTVIMEVSPTSTPQFPTAESFYNATTIRSELSPEPSSFAISNPNNTQIPKTEAEILEKLAGVTEQLAELQKQLQIAPETVIAPTPTSTPIPTPLIIYVTPQPIKEITDAEAVPFNDSVTIQWRTAEKTTGIAQVINGDLQFSAEKTSVDAYFHTISITGLRPGTLFDYVISTEGNYKVYRGRFQTTGIYKPPVAKSIKLSFTGYQRQYTLESTGGIFVPFKIVFKNTDENSWGRMLLSLDQIKSRDMLFNILFGETTQTFAEIRNNTIWKSGYYFEIENQVAYISLSNSVEIISITGYWKDDLVNLITLKP